MKEITVLMTEDLTVGSIDPGVFLGPCFDVKLCVSNFANLHFMIEDCEPDLVVLAGDILAPDQLSTLIDLGKGINKEMRFFNLYKYSTPEKMAAMCEAGCDLNICDVNSIKEVLRVVRSYFWEIGVDAKEFRTRLNKYVYSVLVSLDPHTAMSGFEYVLECAMEMLLRENRCFDLSADLMRLCSEKFGANVRSVESAMWRYVQQCWNTADLRVKERYFPRSCKNGTKPSVKTFLIELCDSIYAENRSSFCRYFISAENDLQIV